MAKRTGQRGSALLAVVAIGVLLTATAWSGLAVLATQVSVSHQEVRSDQARELAEAGLQWAIAELERDRAFRGTEAHAFAGGHFDVRVEEVQGQPTARRVRVVGRVPAPHGLSVTSTWTGTIERAETPKGPAWRRLVWRLQAR